jgi:hypothetical protein
LIAFSGAERFRHTRDNGIVSLFGCGRIGHGKAFGYLSAMRQQMVLVKNIGAVRTRYDEPIVTVGFVGDNLAGIEILQGEILEFGQIEIERIVRRINRELRAVRAGEFPSVIAVRRRLGLELIRIVDRGAVSVVVISKLIVGARGRSGHCRGHDGAQDSEYE